MKILLDTSVIVELHRRNEATIRLIKRLIETDSQLIISTVTISEILTGSYLRPDIKNAGAAAKRILGQFLWIDLDAEIAEKTAKYQAYLIAEGKIIGYQDSAIAATFSTTGADYLLTLNKKHFERIPEMKGKVYTPTEFTSILRAK